MNTFVCLYCTCLRFNISSRICKMICTIFWIKDWNISDEWTTSYEDLQGHRGQEIHKKSAVHIWRLYSKDTQISNQHILFNLCLKHDKYKYSIPNNLSRHKLTGAWWALDGVRWELFSCFSFSVDNVFCFNVLR